MTRAGLLAMLLLLVLAFALLFRGGTEEEPREEAPVERAEPAPADSPFVPAAAAEAPGSEEEATGGAASAALAPSRSTVPPDGVPAASSDLPAVRGTVVVEEPDGRLVTGLSGKMTIVVDERPAREGGRIRTEQVDVKEGSWSATLLPKTVIKVQDAVLGGREVLIDSPAVTVQSGSVVALHGRFIDLLLTVVDGDSGVELTDVEIRAVFPVEVASSAFLGLRLRSPSVLPPLRHDALVKIWRDGVPSPILIHRKELDSWDGMAVYLHASHHAWCLLEIERDATSQTVSLPRAARLAVTVLNPPVRPECFLRLRLTGEGETPGRLMHEQQVDVTDPRIVLRDIQPCRVTASVELGSKEPLVLAQDAVDLLPGQLTSVVLHCSPAPELPAAVIVAGTLFFPQGWGVDFGPWLSLTLVDVTLAVEESSRTVPPERMLPGNASGLFLWESEPILPGRCMVSVLWSSGAGQQHWHVLIDIPPQGDRTVLLQVPPPAELIVRILLDGKESDSLCGSLSWSAGIESSGGESRGFCFFYDWPVRILVPIGPVRLEATGTEPLAGSKAEQVVQVGPGRNETTLDLRCGAGLRVVLREEGRERPPSRSWLADDGIAVVPVGHDGAITSSAWEQRTLYVSAPGAYEVRIGPIQGFQPVPAQRVHLRQGQIVDLIVDLIPAQ